MKAEGKSKSKSPKSPLTDGFHKYADDKYALLVLLGPAAGQYMIC